MTGVYHDAGIDLPTSLLRLYEAHRALVRAKVACLSMSHMSDVSATKHQYDTSEYLNLSTAATVATQPVLIAMTGLSGTGNVNVAQAIGQALGVTVFASDVTRKRLANVDGPASAPWQQGIYSPEWTDRTYARLLDGADVELRRRRPVVVDATFLDERWRREAASRATHIGASVIFVEVTCDPAVVQRRIRARMSGGASVSDASVDTFREQGDSLAAHPIRFPGGAPAVAVDTSSDGPVRIGRVLEALIEIGALKPQIEDGRG